MVFFIDPNLGEGDHVPEPTDIRASASGSDDPLLRAVREYGTRKDPDGNKFLAVLRAAESPNINAQDRQGYTPLMLACKARNAKLARMLMKVPGIDLNARNRRGFSAAMIAACQHYQGAWLLNDLVSEMVDVGYDVNLKEDGGRTLWGVACDHENEKVLEMLHTRGYTFENSGMAADPRTSAGRMQHEKYGPHVFDEQREAHHERGRGF